MSFRYRDGSQKNGVPVDEVYKVGEGTPTVVDLIEEGRVNLVLNTPMGRKSKYDERAIRLAAVAHGIPCVTTLPGAAAAVCGIEALRSGAFEVRGWQMGKLEKAVFAETRGPRKPGVINWNLGG